jgi:hypothetical protein
VRENGLWSLTNYSDTYAPLSDEVRGVRIGSPRPNVGEGLGVRGIPLCRINPRNLALDGCRETLARTSSRARPLTPDPAPALGRGGPNSFWVLQSRRLLSLYCVRLNSTAIRNYGDVF